MKNAVENTVVGMEVTMQKVALQTPKHPKPWTPSAAESYYLKKLLERKILFKSCARFKESSLFNSKNFSEKMHPKHP